MILYNRKKVKYRKDGYCWKKRKDGKTTREDHMKLKVQGVEVGALWGWLWAVLGQEVMAPQSTSTQQRLSTLSEKYSYLLNSICSPWPGSQLLAGVKPQLTPLPANILVVYHSFEQTVSTASPSACVVLPGLCDC